MSSTPYRETLKDLLKGTMARLPHMTFAKEFQQATLEDWSEAARYVGIERFSAGVVEARKHSEFFPHLDLIAQYMPERRRTDAEKVNRELRDLQRRKDAGEKFYTLGDVLVEFCREVEAGERKSADPEKQTKLMAFAKKIGKDVKAYAAKMLSTETRKPPSAAENFKNRVDDRTEQL